jgi:hypothetical protein
MQLPTPGKVWRQTILPSETSGAYERGYSSAASSSSPPAFINSRRTAAA